MSSLVRRIQRQVSPSASVVTNEDAARHGAKPVIGRNPPRKVFYMGRGSKLGVRNPGDKALLARLKREERNRNRKN